MRENFSNKWTFVLACIGSAVGLANIWAFPYRVTQFGGGAFLLAYFLIAVLLGLVGVTGEICLGRWGKTGALGSFEKALSLKNKPLRKIGIIPVLGSYAIGIGYAVVLGWMLCYFVGTISGELFKPQTDIAGFFGSIIGDFGSVKWHILALVLTFVVAVFGVKRGIEATNKIMMPLFFLLFVLLALWVASLDGASKGYEYLFVPKWEFLAQPQTWIAALGQCFFSLSLAGSGTVVYGSYFGRSEDAFGAAVKITFFASFTVILASIVIIPAAFAFNLDLASIKGPPLLFIILPEIFRTMPGGLVFGTLFFIAVLFAAITSIINLFETPIESLQNTFKFSRLSASLVVIVLAALVGVWIENANYVGLWMDLVSIYAIPLGALISAVVFFWILGKSVVLDEVNLGRDKPLASWFYLAGKWVFVPLVALVLVLGIALGGI